MSESGKSKVFAVVVTYNADPKMLFDLVAALFPQVSRLIIVDNTECKDFAESALADLKVFPCVDLIQFGSNLGIATALNVGIKASIDGGASHVLLCDQDSLPARDMVGQLLEAAQKIAAYGLRVGCVGPAFSDQLGRVHKFQIPNRKQFFYETRELSAAEPWVEVVSAITSGSLIPAHAFVDVGLMREDYFIDFVDTEWCFRARAKGYKIFCRPAAAMKHHVGGEKFDAWYGRWVTFNAYPTDRLYYQYRNGLRLLRSGVVPLPWGLRMSWTWLGNICAYVLFAPQRIRNSKAILEGIWDGVRGCGGRRGATSK